MSKLEAKLEKKVMLRCSRSHSVVFGEAADVNEIEIDIKNWKTPAVYGCYDHYVINLEEDNGELAVLQPFCEPLLDEIRGPGSIICLESRIYSIPYLRYYGYENITEWLPYPSTGESVKRLAQMSYVGLDETKITQKWVRSGSRLDKVHIPKEWIISSSVLQIFLCAAMSGVIYGLLEDLKTALCFNLSDNKWSVSSAPPSPDLNGFSVTRNMIPDPVNGRILVHLRGPDYVDQSVLYAWHPLARGKNDRDISWRCLEEYLGTSLWYCDTTLVSLGNKSLLFFFINDKTDVFRVWSIDEHKFIDVRLSNEFSESELELVCSSCMCYSGDNQLCLAIVSPIGPIVLFVFEIKLSTNIGAKRKRRSDTSSDDIITVTLVSRKTFRVLDTHAVVDITPLGVSEDYETVL